MDFTKLGICIDIVEIWFGIAIVISFLITATVYILSVFELSPHDMIMAWYYCFTFLLLKLSSGNKNIDMSRADNYCQKLTKFAH